MNRPRKADPPPDWTESVREATRLMAIRCETKPHEIVNGRCCWCGKDENE